jgi:TonB family protein
MILLSGILHAVVLSALFLSPSLPTPKLTFGPIYSVQLVSLSENFLRGRDISAVSGEFSHQSPAHGALVLKKQTDAASVPVKRTEVSGRDFRGVEKAVDNIRQRASVSADARKYPVNTEIEKKMNIYYTQIWARIKSQWVMPQSILPRENIEAVIHARVLRNGAVMDLSFEKRSGNRYFDESAMKAVQKASPLPPLPEWVRDSSIDIGIRFHSSDLR